MSAIADTGFVLAFLDRNDLHHKWAVEVASQLRPPYLTCEAVLAEVAFHIRSSELTLELLEKRFLKIAFDCKANLRVLSDLATRYADRQPDLADLCLVRMSELYPNHVVVTVDEADFRVYRRNRREAIPLLCPPRR